MRFVRLVALGCTVLLCACGGPAPVRTQYLLRAEMRPRAAHAEGQMRVGLGRVSVAAYLDQSGIVVETGGREVRPAQNHHWAEPLAVGLRLLLRDEISNALGEEVGLHPADYVVNVFVEQFHGTMSGRAVLVAGFQIEARANRGVTEYRFGQSQALDRKGYAALVDAEVELARRLAQEIATALRQTTTERSGP